MPPKKRAPGAKSSAMKQIDDMISQSEIPEGKEASQISLELQKGRMIELNEKFLQTTNPIALMKNDRSLQETRLLTTVCAGVVAGILGFDGAIGLLFYFLVDMLVGFVLLARFGFKAEPHFTSLSKIFTASLAANTMTFMVSWVFFYNLVYIL